MPGERTPTTTTISVFTRHNPKCPKKDTPQWKRRKCCKSLYVYENGKLRYKSAKTKSWEKAENLANEERKARNREEIKLREIAEDEAARRAEREAVQAAKNIAIKGALARWTASIEKQSKKTRDAYQIFVRKVLKWAKSQKVEYLQDGTAAMLDEWRSAKQIPEVEPGLKRKNFNALDDSIGEGGINRFEVPYRIIIQNAEPTNNNITAYIRDFGDLIMHLKNDDCPVDLEIEQL